VLAGSWFGVALPPGSFLAAAAPIHGLGTGALIDLSLLAGVVHLVTGNALAARARKDAGQARVHVAWIAVFIGAALAWFGRATAPVPVGGAALMTLGLLGVMVESARAGPANGLQRLVLGLIAATRVVGAVGDVLSYLRLFALGYAGAALAAAFNALAHDVAIRVPWGGMALAALVLVVGHALNLVLCAAGGVVHALRLNYIEFFNWSMWDEGRPFRAFAKRGKATWITS
jgi:V/A-type H+-transporting ATPase subunit I